MCTFSVREVATIRRGVITGAIAALFSGHGADDVRPSAPAVEHVDGHGSDAAADSARQAREALRRAYRPGDDWSDMFARLTPAEVDELRILFPYMPPIAARHFAEFFVVPHGTSIRS